MARWIRFFKIFLAMACLWPVIGCSSNDRYVGLDCNTSYKGCVSRCRQLDTSTSVDMGDMWAGAKENCYLRCETEKRKCVMKNQ